jgi:membrane associated rhomboid family serine protease
MLHNKLTHGLGHRLTTFPLVHLSLFHLVINVIPLLPLLEKFEEENSTIVTLLLFFGRKSPQFQSGTVD